MSTTSASPILKEWQRYVKASNCPRCPRAERLHRSRNLIQGTCMHNDVAYNSAPKISSELHRGSFVDVKAPVSGWRFHTMSTCVMSTRNLRAKGHPALESGLSKRVLHRQDLSVGHGTNWVKQSPATPCNNLCG